MRGAALQIKVFIVGNVRLYREGLAALLRGCPSIEVLACAASGIDGYVPMDAALGDMVAAIENVVRDTRCHSIALH